MIYLMLCMVVFLSWATLAAGETVSCVTKSRALIGISESVLAQAFALLKDKDEAALQVMINRGQIVRADRGITLRTEDALSHVMRVRLPGYPDMFYTYGAYLDCQK